MAIVTPKTIVITTSGPSKSVPSVLATSTNVNMSMPMDRVLMAESGLEGGRKRRRLTHLSPEERLLRRKLKNRVAAQTARDRKKARMDDLEDLVNTLEEENRRLESENQTLKSQSGQLVLENQRLREKLGHTTEHPTIKREAESSESAELVVPPPQELAQNLSGWMSAQCATLVLTLALMTTCLNSSSKSQQQQPLRSTATQTHRNKLISVKHRPRFHPWWGPQQQSWTPSMN